MSAEGKLAVKTKNLGFSIPPTEDISSEIRSEDAETGSAEEATPSNCAIDSRVPKSR